MEKILVSTFKISSGIIIVTNPFDSKEILSGEISGIIGGPRPTYTKCIIDNVLCGTWKCHKKQDDNYDFVHESYTEHNLQWTEYQICYPNTTEKDEEIVIGLYDFKQWNPNISSVDQFQDFGYTMCSGDPMFIQIGRDEEDNICGVRDSCSYEYYCDNCGNITSNGNMDIGTRFRCKSCDEYDLCASCYKIKHIVHDINHNFRQI